MISRALTLLAIMFVAILALISVGFVRGGSGADNLMRHVDGRWVRVQTQFSPFHAKDRTGEQLWQFYYEPRDREYRRSAPIVIPANILGNLPRRLKISFIRSQDPVTLSPDASVVSKDEAYSLSSPFWNQPYTFSLKSSRPKQKR